MIFVPGGSFKMGSPEGKGYDNERPQHDVTVPGFYIGKYQITQAQWEAAMGKNPSHYAFGLYDMHGNVWEWCEDVWHSNYKDAPADGSAWLSGTDSSARVVRGGSWNRDEDGCRSAFRDWIEPGYHDDHLGVRVVVSARALTP